MNDKLMFQAKRTLWSPSTQPHHTHKSSKPAWLHPALHMAHFPFHQKKERKKREERGAEGRKGKGREWGGEGKRKRKEKGRKKERKKAKRP